MPRPSPSHTTLGLGLGPASSCFVIGLALGVASLAQAQTISQVASYQGRAEFVLTGASMTDNAGLNNGVNCLKSSATATVFPSDLPARPRLIKATLYIGGSLIDDGVDYGEGNVSIFSNGDLRADDQADIPALEVAAKNAADVSVSFQPPGAAAPVTVSATNGSSYVSLLYKDGGPEEGNLAFFVTPIDVTNAIKVQGNGVLAGDYEVSGLLADVCMGLEAICGSGSTCGNQAGSSTHTNGAASWALYLIIEDPSLPLRSITTFEGLLGLSGASTTQLLELPHPISDPSSGALAFYALEGDLTLPTGSNTNGPCSADEYIEVDGDANPSADGLCLEDDDNQTQNLFNGTINVQPANGQEPECAPADDDFLCCLGDGLCGVVGVDIDRFNISEAIEPGVTDVRVTVGSGQDRIYLASMILGIEVFQPVLNVDTQIRVLTADDAGHVQLGDDVIYSIAISNTGNEPASNVSILMNAPPATTGFQVQRIPEGATDLSNPTGGTGSGVVHVQDFTVAAGEIAEVRLRLRSTCQNGALLNTTASVTGTGVSTFQVAAPTVTLRGPGILECEGMDPGGPFQPEILPDARQIRGGGCASTELTWFLLVPALALLRKRRRTEIR